jgi:hypothetical protein
VTDQIGTHGLSCISDDDYAAYALSMQCNAEAIDEALSNTNESFGEYLGRPWVQVVNSFSIAVSDDAAGGSIGPLGFVGESMGPESGAGIPITTSFNMATPIGATNPLQPGVWLIGASIDWTLAAATANSYRQLMVYGVRNIGGVVQADLTYTDLYRMRDYQGDGGNNGALNVVGFLDTTAGDVATVNAFFSHANVAGVLTVAPGDWRMWAMYLGTGLTI